MAGVLFSMPYSGKNLFGNEPKGYVVGFFNGINTHEEQAYASLMEIKQLMGRENIVEPYDPFNNLKYSWYNGEIVDYETFYNQTEGWFKDILEVFEQRANEVDLTGDLASRTDLLWDLIDGAGTLWDALSETDPRAFILREALEFSILEVYHKHITQPLDANYTDHINQLTAYIDAGQKLLLIAHSQGNLFANRAFEHILNNYPITYRCTDKSCDSVKIIHVAPASQNLYGPPYYVLSRNDRVIRPLLNTPEWNVDITTGFVDLLGHNFIKEYLYKDDSKDYDKDSNGRYVDGYRAIRAYITEALSALVAPLGTTFTGEIRSYYTDKPIPEADITVDWVHDKAGEPVPNIERYTYKSNEDGKFTDVLYPGGYTFEASAAGYESYTDNSPYLIYQYPEHERKLVLIPNLTIPPDGKRYSGVYEAVKTDTSAITIGKIEFLNDNQARVYLLFNTQSHLGTYLITDGKFIFTPSDYGGTYIEMAIREATEQGEELLILGDGMGYAYTNVADSPGEPVFPMKSGVYRADKSSLTLSGFSSFHFTGGDQVIAYAFDDTVSYEGAYKIVDGVFMFSSPSNPNMSINMDIIIDNDSNFFILGGQEFKWQSETGGGDTNYNLSGAYKASDPMIGFTGFDSFTFSSGNRVTASAMNGILIYHGVYAIVNDIDNLLGTAETLVFTWDGDTSVSVNMSFEMVSDDLLLINGAEYKK